MMWNRGTVHKEMISNPTAVMLLDEEPILRERQHVRVTGEA